MQGGSWASYQSALPNEARAGGEPDDDPAPVGRHDREPPDHVVVEWFEPQPFIDHDTGIAEDVCAPTGRWFPAERWAWKHALAWRDAMTRRHGHSTIDYVF